MEPIDKVDWDVVISGTGFAESLLALSLSRSEKKVLHVDPNGYYGGAEAALSLQDAEQWVNNVAEGRVPFFSNAEITRAEDGNSDGGRGLGFSRAYSIALAPQIIYTRSALIPVLVSSKVYRQLEFMAVGSWWLYDANHTGEEASSPLRRIPSRREDIFADKSLDLKAKRMLIKFLRLAMDTDANSAAITEFGNMDLEAYLTKHFGIPPILQAGLHALSLSPFAPNRTPVWYALPRIMRHLSSFGIFGLGFCAVLPKWGGYAEIAQVACRALAVGGGVYMLGTGIRAPNNLQSPSAEAPDRRDNPAVIDLASGDTVRTRWLAQSDFLANVPELGQRETCTRSATIVGTTLQRLLPSLGEGAAKPAAAIVVFPAGSLDGAEPANVPIHLMVHSSDSGECPAGEAIIYASVSGFSELASRLLSRAVERLVTAAGESVSCIQWTLQYQQHGLHAIRGRGPASDYLSNSADQNSAKEIGEVAERPQLQQNRLHLPPPSLDLAFEDRCLEPVKAAWSTISGRDNGFMEFEDRELGAYDSDDAEP